jgi:hypothetical protein
MLCEPCPSDDASRRELTEFLLAAFHLPPGAPFVRPELLRWKYDEPRLDFPGPRSYVCRDGGKEIVAHACVCPVTYNLPTRDVKAAYLIDWGAARSSPGAGTSLLRSMAKKFDVLLAVGGSPDTQTILPKPGYRKVGEMQVFARVLRAWDQFRSDPFPRGWKAPLRLARNVLWSRGEAPPVAEGWTAQPTGAFDRSCQPLFEDRAHFAFPSTRRTPALMNYWLACPGAAMSASLVRYNGEIRGWFVLSRVLGQARIVDLWVNSNLVADWAAAFSLAVRAAMQDPEANELIAAVSIPPATEAAPLAGLRARPAEPIFALDPNNCFGPGPALNVTPLESDLAYVQDPSYPYLT